MSEFNLTDEQKSLIPKLKDWYNNFSSSGKKWFSLSGAAGTGKTTVIRYFIEDMGFKLTDIICAAYVGKAVTVLAAHGLPARTIHSLIYNMVWKNVYDGHGNIVLDQNGMPKLGRSFELKERLDWEYKLIVIDEASMVNDDLRDDILSFGVPVIFIGDMHQLPPIFGKSSVMMHPDFVLTKIMRQAEDNPIIYLSQGVLHGRALTPGQYGTSKIITQLPLDESLLTDYDIILTAKNSTREMFNNFIRFQLLKAPSVRPSIGDKIICRQNNWNIDLGKGFFLTNGSAGVIEDIYRQSINENSRKIDFLPDVTGEVKQSIDLDYKYIQLPYLDRKLYGISRFNKFEYGYAITTHLSQGSQYPRVLFIDEFFHSVEDTRAMRYTAITRAMYDLTIVVAGPKH